MKIVNFAKQTFKKVNKKLFASSVMAASTLMLAVPAFAAPATGDEDIDEILTSIDGWFAILKSGFKYIALAAIVITGFVLAFFWLRGKLKQAVSGA